MTAAKATQNTPHHTGHRDRLRARFLKSGPEALADYELLELILFTAIPRRDVKPLAKELLQKFGGFGPLLNASPEKLQQAGISENVATHLKVIKASALTLLKEELKDQPILNSWSRLLAYLKADMSHETIEHFRVLYLNKKNRLIADETQGSGTVDHTPAYPREIVKRALELGATAMILVHNHPSGDPAPSQADIDLTDAVATAAEAFDILVHDHIIVGKSDVASFKSLGLL